MKKLLLGLLLLCSPLLARAASPLFVGSTTDYFTNTGTAGTITFVFSNNVRMIFVRGGTSTTIITNPVPGLTSIFSQGTVDGNGTILQTFNLGDSGGHSFNFCFQVTSNTLAIADGISADWLRITRSTGLLEISNVVGVHFFAMSNFVATNVVLTAATNATANTNMIVNYDQNSVDIYATNNLSFTNQSGLTTNSTKSVMRFITPVLINRTVVWPTLGGSSFGYKWFTNANSQMWTTLTNGKTYALSLTARGTNVHASLTEW